MTNQFELMLNDGRQLKINLQPLAEWLSKIRCADSDVEKAMQIITTTYEVMSKSNPEIANIYFTANLLINKGTELHVSP